MPKGASTSELFSTGFDNLEPDIKKGDQGCQPKPLKSIAVVFFNTAGWLRPFTQQSGLSRCSLLHTDFQQGKSRFLRISGQVQILPYLSNATAIELKHP